MKLIEVLVTDAENASPIVPTMQSEIWVIILWLTICSAMVVVPVNPAVLAERFIMLKVQTWGKILVNWF